MPNQERTRQAAVRYLKAQMRQFAYQVKSKEAPDIWEPMLLVEQSFLAGARNEWDEVRTLCSNEQSVIAAALPQAKVETADLLRERISDIQFILDQFQPLG